VGSSNVRCTTENFNDAAIGAANDGIGTLVTGSGTVAAGIFARPFNTSFKYDAILPNVGVSWEFAENHTVYASFAEGLSAPRTDNLYFVIATRTGPLATDPYTTSYPGVEPERTKSYDLGYRFQGETVTASVAVWKNTFENRIVTSFDQNLGVNVDRNVGTVELQGLDLEVGARPMDGLTVYASASYNESELQDDLNLGRAADLTLNLLPLKGKTLVETPEWTFAGRVQYQLENFTFGLQGKYVGDRFSTDVNDEIAEAYTIFDANVVADLAGYGLGDTQLQLNAINLFDENYLGNISTQTNALTIADVNPGPLVVSRTGSAPSYSIGAPQTFQLQLRTKF
jgi:iron complex outermembrane receptor protein